MCTPVNLLAPYTCHSVRKNGSSREESRDFKTHRNARSVFRRWKEKARKDGIICGMWKQAETIGTKTSRENLLRRRNGFKRIDVVKISGDKKVDMRMSFACTEELKESVPHVSYNGLCKAFRLHGEKERRCNRKVAPLKQRFLTRCSRMAVSDAVCVI